MIRQWTDSCLSQPEALQRRVVSQFEAKPSKRHSRASGNPAQAVSAALELDASFRWHDVKC